MVGAEPTTIITDQDPAMSKAIAQEFVNTFHKFCIWHLLIKFSEKLPAIAYRDNYKSFQKCIWESVEVEEFDSKRKSVLKSAGLTDHEWLQGIFDIKSKWMPVYCNGMFFG